MRTTLTLDPDVAALLDQVREKEGLGLKEAVNEGLRYGLLAMTRPRESTPFRTKPWPDAALRIDNVDNVWKVLEELEQPE
ncbi:MAG: hypothetical protein SFV18_05920 [Bryobacteraceae bacterium]|nr:hypothetical protein [Bryobacteraceae bacterium]